MAKVTLVAGDGIGPEIAASVKEIFNAAGAGLEWDEVQVGLEAFKATNTLIPQSFYDSMERTGLALKGPTTTPVGGGHRSINVTMRQAFDLFASVRPVKNFDGVACNYKSVDIIIVRENTEDLYKGVEYKIGENTAHGIKIITAEASERIVRHAFELAQKLKRRKVTAAHKANIMKFTDGLFLESARKVAKEFPDIQFDDIIIDNCCMQLVCKPEQFDIIVTENLYGDILSDLCAGLVGGLGVAPGANFGKGKAVFEAAHGSAPDIAGKNLANPTALLLSGVMLLEYIQRHDIAHKIQSALAKALAQPSTRTKDLGGALSTTEFTKKIISLL